MRRTGQLRVLVGTGLASLVVGLLLAASAYAAVPPDLTDTFDSGDDGWSIYDGNAIGPVDWKATSGNPGGFLSYTGTGAEGDDASFGDAGYVAHLSRYLDRARIVADMRSTAAAAGAPLVRLIDPAYPAFGSISSSAGAPLSTRWRHYSFPLRASADWYDDSGDLLDAGELRRFLNLDPVILIAADYGTATATMTDLDNVGLISEWPRGVSIRARAGAKGFKGVITIEEGFDAPQCLTGQKVRIVRKSKRSTRGFATATTNDAGKYSVTKNVKPGRYFARIPKVAQPSGPPCGAAASKTIRVR